MKHIKLFENFSGNPFLHQDTSLPGYTSGLSAVGVFLETQTAVGVFPTPEAKAIYEKLRKSIPEDIDYIVVNIVEIPEGHDLVILPSVGFDMYTSNEAEMKNQIHDVVELGKFYDYGENEIDPNSGGIIPKQMAFRVNPDVNGFVLVDSAGGTHLLSPSEMENHI